MYSECPFSSDPLAVISEMLGYNQNSSWDSADYLAGVKPFSRGGPVVSSSLTMDIFVSISVNCYGRLGLLISGLVFVIGVAGRRDSPLMTFLCRWEVDR